MLGKDSLDPIGGRHVREGKARLGEKGVRD